MMVRLSNDATVRRNSDVMARRSSVGTARRSSAGTARLATVRATTGLETPGLETTVARIDATSAAIRHHRAGPSPRKRPPGRTQKATSAPWT